MPVGLLRPGDPADFIVVDDLRDFRVRQTYIDGRLVADDGRPLIERVGSADKQELVLKGGHVSVVAGRNAVQRLWPKLDAWLGERSI